MLNNKIIYSVKSLKENQPLIIFKSYFPMDNEELMVSILYEGFYIEDDIIIDKLTEEEFNHLNNLNSFKVLTNMNNE